MLKKTVIVTGGSSGIGFETALDMANRGARVIIASENAKDCARAVAQIIEKSKNEKVFAKYLDLSDFKSVRNFAEDILATEDRLDVLINNAGTLTNLTKLTKDGLPVGLQVNYFGHFLLTYLLLDLLKKSGPSRIVNVSSAAYVFGLIDFNDITKLPNYLPKMFDYCNSKLLILYSTLAWAEKLKDYGVTVNCLHPGGVRSNIMLRLKSDITIKIFDVLYYFIHPWIKTTFEGAQTSIHCAVSEECDGVTGEYFSDCGKSSAHISKSPKKIEAVWNQSLSLCNLKIEEKKIL